MVVDPDSVVVVVVAEIDANQATYITVTQNLEF